MKYIITGRNIEVTDSLRDTIQEKLGKLEKFFSQEAEAQVTLSVEKSRHRIEITVPVKGGIIRAEQESSDMYNSIDLACEAIEGQMKKYRKKIIDRYQSGRQLAQEYIEQDFEEESEFPIVKVKKFDFKPMDPEEACMQMELLGHSFFVFNDAETGSTCVVYKRKDGTYGLIEPEF